MKFPAEELSKIPDIRRPRVPDGRLLFKATPSLQDLFSEAVLPRDPELAEQWTKRTLACAGVRRNFPMRELLYRVSGEALTVFEKELGKLLQLLADDLSMTGAE